MAKWKHVDGICPTCGRSGYRPDTVKYRLGSLVRQARNEKGLTQKALGQLFDPPIGHAGVAFIEAGNRRLDLDDLVMLGKILDKPVEYFLAALKEPQEEQP